MTHFQAWKKQVYFRKRIFSDRSHRPAKFGLTPQAYLWLLWLSWSYLGVRCCVGELGGGRDLHHSKTGSAGSWPLQDTLLLTSSLFKDPRWEIPAVPHSGSVFSEQQTWTNPNQVWPVLGARHKTHQQIDTCPVNLRMCSRQVGSISQKTDEGSQERFYPFSWGWPNKRHFSLKHQPTIIHNSSSLQIWNRLLQFRPMATKKWSKS